MNYDELYEIMCANCPNAKKCHDDCTECDAFIERIEENEY